MVEEKNPVGPKLEAFLNRRAEKVKRASEFSGRKHLRLRTSLNGTGPSHVVPAGEAMG